MIVSVREFFDLLESEPANAHRIVTEPAPEAVWLELLSEHPDSRQWVARNKTLPDSILSMLAIDEDAEVRWWIACKRKLPLELFQKLSADPLPSVRHRIACNAKTPIFLLKKLAEDEDLLVSESATNRLKSTKSS